MDWHVIGFDTETTGTNPQVDRLVTATIVEWNRGEIREKSWLADPGIEIPENAQKVHGISTEYARENGESLEKVVKEIADYLYEAGSRGIPVVVYNAGFDLKLIDAHLKRMGQLPLRERLEFWPVLDPLVLDRGLDRYRKGKRTLGAVADVYEVEVQGDLHDASVDVHTTLKVLDKIFTKYPELQEKTLRELVALQVEMYEEWVAGMQEYLERKGKRSDLDTCWV